MSVTPVLLDRGEGRAELVLSPGSLPPAGAVRELVAGGWADPRLRCVVAYVAVDAWDARRLLHDCGFSGDGTLRGWLPDGAGDAWVGMLLRDEPMEPPHRWLDVPELAADGLLLRPWRDSDVPRIVEGCADPVTQRWLGQLPAPYTADSARTWLHQSAERLAAGTAMNWAVVVPAGPDHDPHHDPDAVLASVGWFDLAEGVDCEVGYWVHPEARGRRVATRATEAVVRWAFDVLGVRRVKAFAAVDNTGSRRVLEACGFELYGVERLGAWVREDHVDMALYDRMAATTSG